MDRKYKILLIDDDETLLFGMSLILTQAGYQVVTALGALNGLHAAQTSHPDVIVCDVMMPKLNGFELRQRLSGDPTTRRIPFIFLTSRSSTSDKLHGLESGADDYITKPFDNQEFKARIKAVLRRVELERALGRTQGKQEIDRLRHKIIKGVSYELRTPISYILQTLEMSLMDRFEQEPEQQRTFIQSALNNTYHLQTIVNDLIMLSQLDQGMVLRRRAIRLDLNFYLVISKIEQKWQAKQLNIQVQVEPEVVIYAPQRLFKHAVFHLLDNACKFNPTGKFFGRNQIKVLLAQNGQGGCILTVTDQGPGIPPSHREKVFERFYQISSPELHENEGLGVGLTIARTFARALGGDVVILDSKRGCRVQMTIPPNRAVGSAVISNQ